MVFVETSFPRGGTVNKQNKTINDKDTEIFGASTTKPKIQNKQKSNNPLDKPKTNKETAAEALPTLTANLIKSDGLLVMGIIFKIFPTKLHVQLPCNLFGIVNANSISDSYTSQLKKFVHGNIEKEEFKTLEELFKIGQIVYTKIMSLCENQILLSMNPKDLHSEIIHRKLFTGAQLVVSIVDIEEHGYTIETGIKKLRAFLPQKNITNHSLIIGELVFCQIEKIEKASSESTAILKHCNINNKKELVKQDSFPNMMKQLSLEGLLPCSIVKFTITKVHKHHLEGSIYDGLFHACVPKNHLSSPLNPISKYSVGEEVYGRIICIIPLIKVVYLTLNLSPFGNPKKKLGKIIDNGEIVKILPNAIEVKFEKKCKGIIVNSKNINSYNVGQKIQVKILNYNIFDSVFLCSDDSRLLMESNELSINNLKINDTIDFLVHNITEKGIIGFIGCYGNLKTFMNFYELSMKEVKHNDIIPCKILSINKEKQKLQITNRKEYFNEKKIKILDNLENAEIGNVYTGIVIKDSNDYYIIRFFNFITGLISKNIVNKLIVGDVRNFEISSVKLNENKLYLTLPTNGRKTDSSSIGLISNVVIKSHFPNGLQIELPDNTHGFISNLSFSIDSKLSELLCKSYKEGQKIKCINIGNDVYSVRELGYYENHPIPSFHEIEVNDLIRGYIKNVNDDKIEIFAPIRNYNKKIIIKSTYMLDCKEDLKLLPEQVVMMKVTKKDLSKQILQFTGKLSNTWCYDFNSAVDFFIEYLNDVKKIKRLFKKNKNPLGSFDIGDRVYGKVIEHNEKSKDVILDLGNGVTGLLQFNNKLQTISFKIDDEVECSVIWIDYENKHIDLTTKYNIDQSDDVKEFDENNVVKSKILLRKESFIIGEKTINGKTQLILIPTKIHYNDFHSCMQGYLTQKFKFNVLIAKKYDNIFIGFFEKFYNDMQSFNVGKTKTNQFIRKRQLELENEELIQKFKRMKENKSNSDEMDMDETDHIDEEIDNSNYGKQVGCEKSEAEEDTSDYNEA